MVDQNQLFTEISRLLTFCLIRNIMQSFQILV
uniref:Uncharacterized protein n=1 Tax=Rhizophora mucronata TaxID=61149 RepID=A0A2P2IRT4_RHIMU